MKLKIAYFGTPDFSARFLEKVLTNTDLSVEVVLVVTQPDKPVGRKQISTPSPVKLVAQKYNIPIYDGILNDLPSNIHSLLSNTDLALLFAYGKIIKKDLLEAPKSGFWNVHPSLLPLYRGASPIAYPLMLGDVKTGVTLMHMTEKLDDGPIIAQEKYTILDTDTRSNLETKLTDLGFELFKQMILNVIPAKAGIYTNRSPIRSGMTNDKITTSSATPRNDMTPQNDTEATYTRRLTKQDGYIPLPVLKKALNNEPLSFDELPELIKEYYSQSSDRPSKPVGQSGVILSEMKDLVKRNSSQIVFDYFRGLSPWPGLWTLVTVNGQEKRLKITDASLVLHSSFYKLRIDRVQLEGKSEVDFDQFKLAHQLT